MNVDSDRLRADIEANAEFGKIDVAEGRGRTVLTGTDANRQAREYFVERLKDAGLDVRIDAVGNVAGRWTPESADPDAAPVAAGSHLDSVPEGGIFDGPLGVYAALESVRAMQDADLEPDRPIDVVSFTEEEGQQFAGGLLGSSVAVGDRTVEEALALEDDDGTTLESALESMGFRGEGRLDASEWDAWFELHVEQSERLVDADVPVGVVTAITGITHCDAVIRGEADHAGATPMDDRTDALAAASEFVLDVERAANEVVAGFSDTAVGTVGKLNVRPNATNVVPGQVETGVDIRDVNYDSMNELVQRARRSLARLERERGVETEFKRPFDLEPSPMTDRARKAAHDAGERAGIETMDLHSGAAHDTQRIAGVTDAALLFAPSKDGISHNPKEWTDWDDCAAAARVMGGAIADLAGAER
ncbi:M20 family metallo-hydrolase [Halorussus amylolyticus]|uniref:M20 family metallo-hydrolase n=1 Tax=Halorussus amylolyticus TaxID=1126242 RepID=UPI0010497D43|nr:M20 family metallo-hydrolase [Halorussus amylolyticus]